MIAQEIKVIHWQGKYLVIKYKLIQDEFGGRYSVDLLETCEELKQAKDKKRLWDFVIKRNEEELRRIRKAVNKYVEHIIPRSDSVVKKASGKA